MRLPLKHYLKAGNVFRYKVTFRDGVTKTKRLIVISNDNNYTTLMLTVTSNVHGEYKHYRKEDIFVPQNTEDSFPLPTYVQFHRILVFPISKLIRDYNNNLLEVLDPISHELLKRIYDKIEFLKEKELRKGKVDLHKIRILSNKTI